MDSLTAILLGNAVAVGVLGYLLKIWIERRLSLSLDRKLESFKAELAKDIARDAIQQKWVNDKRMELLGQLNEVMLDMDFEIKALFFNIKVQSKEFTKDRASKVCERYTALNSVLYKSEIFLDSSVVDEVRSTYRPYFDLSMMCLKDEAAVTEQLLSELPDSLEEIAALVDQPRQDLVRAFRRAAGIDA